MKSTDLLQLVDNFQKAGKTLAVYVARRLVVSGSTRDSNTFTLKKILTLIIVLLPFKGTSSPARDARTSITGTANQSRNQQNQLEANSDSDYEGDEWGEEGWQEDEWGDEKVRRYMKRVSFFACRLVLNVFIFDVGFDEQC